MEKIDKLLFKIIFFILLVLISSPLVLFLTEIVSRQIAIRLFASVAVITIFYVIVFSIHKRSRSTKGTKNTKTETYDISNLPTLETELVTIERARQ